MERPMLLLDCRPRAAGESGKLPRRTQH